MNKPLEIRVNHVGIISSILELYGNVDIVSKKMTIGKLRGVLKFSIASRASKQNLYKALLRENTTAEEVNKLKAGNKNNILLNKQIADVLGIDDLKEADIIRRLLFLENNPKEWITEVHNVVEALIAYKVKMNEATKVFLRQCVMEMCSLISVLDNYPFQEVKSILVFDAILLPQGRDQNYGVYYACVVQSSVVPLRSAFRSSEEREAENRGREEDITILYGGRFDRELQEYDFGGYQPFTITKDKQPTVGMSNITIHMENIVSVLLCVPKYNMAMKKVWTSCSDAPSILILPLRERNSMVDLVVANACWREHYRCTWWDWNGKSEAQDYLSYCRNYRISYIIQYGQLENNLSLLRINQKRGKLDNVCNGTVRALLDFLWNTTASKNAGNHANKPKTREVEESGPTFIRAGSEGSKLGEAIGGNQEEDQFVFLNVEMRNKKSCEGEVRKALQRANIKNSAFVIMIMSRIARVREVVSMILANESVVNYIPKSTAVQIQHAVDECKRDCIIFYALGDDLFDILFIASIKKVDRIADEKKK